MYVRVNRQTVLDLCKGASSTDPYVNQTLHTSETVCYAQSAHQHMKMLRTPDPMRKVTERTYLYVLHHVSNLLIHQHKFPGATWRLLYIAGCALSPILCNPGRSCTVLPIMC